jgi:hypothetical protein
MKTVYKLRTKKGNKFGKQTILVYDFLTEDDAINFAKRNVSTYPNERWENVYEVIPVKVRNNQRLKLK